jgi:hypothetical protein
MEAEQPKPEKDPATGRFVTGNIGGGRPKGAKAKLGEMFLEALRDDFEVNGVTAIVEVRETRPQDYLKVIASLMPKDLNLNVNNLDDATDAELVQRLRDLESVIRPFLAAEGSGNVGEGAGQATAH